MTIAQAINRTVKYSKKYQTVLSREELKMRLISGVRYSEPEIDEYLNKKNQNIKKNNNRFLKRKIDLAKKIVAEHLIKFPSILLVGISGSVAARHPQNGDDIDLLIVTKKNRLWWTRFWLRVYVFLHSIPHRRYGFPEKKDDYCFNLWLEADSMKLPTSKQNIDNALDLVMMIPILDRKDYYYQFINENNWAGKLVATYYQKINKKVATNRFERNGGSRWLDQLNYLFYILQYGYMKKKIKGELVDLNMAFFHQNKFTDKMLSVDEDKKQTVIKVYPWIIAGMLILGCLVVLISLLRFGLEKTLADDRKGVIRKKQVEIILVDENKIPSAKFYKLPDSGMLSNSKWYRIKQLRDWAWLKLTNKVVDKINLILLMADKEMVEAEHYLARGETEPGLRAGNRALDKLKYAKSIRETNPNINSPEAEERWWLAGNVYGYILDKNKIYNDNDNDDYDELIDKFNQWNEAQKNKKEN